VGRQDAPSERCSVNFGCEQVIEEIRPRAVGWSAEAGNPAKECRDPWQEVFNQESLAGTGPGVLCPAFVCGVFPFQQRCVCAKEDGEVVGFIRDRRSKDAEESGDAVAGDAAEFAFGTELH
jgi:hypothetical protein